MKIKLLLTKEAEEKEGAEEAQWKIEAMVKRRLGSLTAGDVKHLWRVLKVQSQYGIRFDESEMPEQSVLGKVWLEAESELVSRCEIYGDSFAIAFCFTSGEPPILLTYGKPEDFGLILPEENWKYPRY